MRAWFKARTFIAELVLVSGLAAVAFGSSPSRAASLTGDTINGVLNFCTLGNGGNTFTPSSGQAPHAFQFTDGSNTDTATFSATDLTVEANVSDFACGWGMSFTDATTPFPGLSLVSSNFSPDLTFQRTGDGTIDISWAGTPGALDSISDPGDFTAVFNFDAVVDAPEPASIALFIVGLAGVGLIRQRCRSAALVS
jgi:hypothetical protein